MTSVRKRAGPPARRGWVMPFELCSLRYGREGGGFWHAGLGSGAHRGAHRVERRLRPVQTEAQRALADQDLEAVDNARAPLLRLCDQHGAACPVDQVDHGRVSPERIGARGSSLNGSTIASPTDVQLTRTSAATGVVDDARAELARALGRAVPDRRRRRRPARSAQATARALPPAPSTQRGARRAAAERGEQAGRVGVVGVDRAVVAERQRVRRADRAGGVAGRRRQRERRLLVRDRDVRAAKPDAPSARTVSSNASGATGRRW